MAIKTVQFLRSQGVLSSYEEAVAKLNGKWAELTDGSPIVIRYTEGEDDNKTSKALFSIKNSVDSSAPFVVLDSNAKVEQIEASIKALEEQVAEELGENGSVAAAIKALKEELLGDAADGYNTLGKLEDQIQQVAADAKSYEVVAIEGDKLAALGENVKEAFKLVDEDGTQAGQTIKIYKDSALKEVVLDGQELKFTYILADGQESTVGVDVSKFLAESEFGDGLEVVSGVVKVNVGEDTTEKKNFLDFEEDGDLKALAVRSIDTDSTVTTDRILVAGGPLDSTALRGILPKDESGNAYIEAGTDVQSLLLSLFTKVEWPTPTVTEGAINTTIAAPSFTLKNGSTDASDKTYEVGTVLTMSDVTLSEVVNATSARTCSEFTYGYSDSANGTINKDKVVSIEASNVTVNGDNYTMSRDFTTFTNADDSATPSTTASEVTLAGASCILQEGECKVKVTVKGPKGECTFAEMPSYFVTSNVGTLSDEHQSPTKDEAVVKEDTTPSNSKEIKVNGRYKYFVGYSTKTSYDQFDSASIKALAAKSDNITVNGTTTVLNDTTKLKSDGTSIIVACPVKYKLATITNGVGADILANFSSKGKIDYTNGSVTTEYMVYVYPITNGATVEFKNLTLTKA